MLTSSNQRIRIPFLTMYLSLLIASSVFGQIYVDDALFIGNSDGSPFHVPYQGVVDMPVWIDQIYQGSSGFITLETLNFAVSERLGGNFHYPWEFIFSQPLYYADYSTQLFGFLAYNPPDSLIHLADFSFRMDIDPTYINDTLQVMSALGELWDSTGTNIVIYISQISQLIIDDITSSNGDDFKPNRFILSQNYPNPFNAQTTIQYSLSEPSDVTIEIYDLLGRKVETLVDEEKLPGRHQVIWDASEYSSGVYFYRIQAGNMIETKRMVLLK